MASGALLAATGLTAAVPSFFVAYFLQIAVIVFGANPTTGSRFLPIYGFGYDEHIILPLLAVAVPAVAITAQLTCDASERCHGGGVRHHGEREGPVPELDRPRSRSATCAARSSSKGSVPASASRSRAFRSSSTSSTGTASATSRCSRSRIATRQALTASALVLVTLFALLSFIADIGRPRFAYR
jgi:hypothetical protein